MDPISGVSVLDDQTVSLAFAIARSQYVEDASQSQFSLWGMTSTIDLRGMVLLESAKKYNLQGVEKAPDLKHYAARHTRSSGRRGWIAVSDHCSGAVRHNDLQGAR